MSKNKFEVFAGLCIIESELMTLELARSLKEQLLSVKGLIDFTFKASFDKANRSSIHSYRGPGLTEGLRILTRVKEELGISILTDFHLPEQAEPLAEKVDILQVPAFLCRQTDMIVEGAKSCKKYGRRLNIKKGQFLSPEETANVVEKATKYLPPDKIMLTERGSCFGYNNLVVDMASFQIIKHLGVRAIYDATHSVQRPGGLGDSSGGKREQIQVLAQAATAAGADGVFLETHFEPERSLSDSATCLPINRVRPMVEQLLKIYQVI